MRSECIQAVSQALGRNATQQETRDIENRLRLAMRRLAAEDPNSWHRLNQREQLERAGEEAAKELTHEAALRRHRTALSILAHDRVQNYIDAQIRSGADKDGVSALRRLLVSESDGKNNVASVESLIHGLVSDADTYMVRSWNVTSGKFLHMLRDPAAERTLVRALYGDATVPETFRKAADDFHTSAERLRNAYNAEGGDIGRLDNWGIPQHWADHLLLKAGKQAWTDAMMPLLDRSRYVHEDGRAYSEAEMRQFLDEAWQTIVTDGANKIIGGEHAGAGVKANRHGAERQIHLKDPDSHLRAMYRFSDRGVMEVMMGHIHRMARDLALVKQFGPNADRQFAHLLQQEEAKAIVAHPDRRASIQRDAQLTERVYNFLAGNGTPPPDTVLGKTIQVWRNLQILKLGSTLITALTDKGPMWAVAHVNGIPKIKMFLNELRHLNPLDKDAKSIAESAGLMVRQHAAMLARFGADIGAHGWSSKLGNTMLKVSGVSRFWDAERKALSLGLMNQVGKALQDHASLADLTAADQRFIKHSGITDTDWDVMRLAQLENWGGNEHLITPEAIHRIPDTAIARISNRDPDLVRMDASARLMGFVLGEQDRGVLEPDALTRVKLGADRSLDTSIAGLLLSSFRMFKAYPSSFLRAHWVRALRAFETKRGSVGYGAALVATTTVLGAMSLAINDIVSGRDPRTFNPTAKEGWKNWAAALAKGGGLGIYGDLLINTAGNQGRNTLPETLAGPMFADVAKLLNVGQAIVSSSTDPDASALKKLRPTGPSTVDALKPYVPGANLWYAKAALSHLIFNQLSEYLSPGYLGRMKQRARQQGHTYWWQPDQAAPDRAPDLSHVAADH